MAPWVRLPGALAVEPGVLFWSWARSSRPLAGSGSASSHGAAGRRPALCFVRGRERRAPCQRPEKSVFWQSSLPLFSAGKRFISCSSTAVETKKIPCFFSSFLFFVVFFLFFLPLTSLSCKEETPTYVLPCLCESEDISSPAQFHDLGWIFEYKSSCYGFYLKRQQIAGC